MTPQERIAQLCEKAMTSDPAVPSTVKAQPFLDTSDMSPEQVEALRALGVLDEKPVAKKETIASERPASAKTENPVEVKAPVFHASVKQENPEFGLLLEERESRMKKRAKRTGLVVNLLLLTLFGGSATAFVVSPSLQGKVRHLVDSLQEGVEDVKMMGKGTDNYDEALKEVAERGNQIDEATRAMGVDPSSVDPGDAPNMLAEMNQLAGEDIGLDSRLGKLKSMGRIGQAVTDAEGPKSRDELSAPEASMP